VIVPAGGSEPSIHRRGVRNIENAAWSTADRFPQADRLAVAAWQTTYQASAAFKRREGDPLLPREKRLAAKGQALSPEWKSTGCAAAAEVSFCHMGELVGSLLTGRAQFGKSLRVRAFLTGTEVPRQPTHCSTLCRRERDIERLDQVATREHDHVGGTTCHRRHHGHADRV
jgi:hypothetical protein